jgi:hypothetical protein
MENYRYDNRTQDQFIQDIKKGTARERLAISLFKNYLRREFGFTGVIKENGCDMSGAFIEDGRKVSTEADYLVGEAQLPLEVKTSAGHIINIHIKAKQLDSYIRQGASILYVNGIEQNVPAFTLWTVEELKHMREILPTVIPPRNINGGKLSYRINALDYHWRTFGGDVKRYVF